MNNLVKEQNKRNQFRLVVIDLFRTGFEKKMIHDDDIDRLYNTFFKESYTEGYNRGKEEIREYVKHYMEMHKDWQNTAGQEEYAQGGIATCEDLLTRLQEMG